MPALTTELPALSRRLHPDTAFGTPPSGGSKLANPAAAV